MNIKKTAKKIAAIGAGVGLMSMSLVGALAVDLADYPDNFFTGGAFDGKIVVGANAATQDVLGAIDIAASLQAASTVEVSVGSGSSQTILTGDTKQIGDASDSLEIGEPIGNVLETLTEDDLQMLQGGRITTSKGSTDFTQNMDLDVTTTSGIVGLYEDNDDNTDVFLFFDDGQQLFNLDIEFTSGLESDVENLEAEDLEDESLFVLGQYYSIVQATVGDSGSNSLSSLLLELIAGDVVDTLTEGETRTYTVDGKDYEVTVLVIGSSTTGGTAETNVKFLVNGEVTDSMNDGDTDTLSDGLEIGVREIIETTAYREQDAGSVVEFYLGANKIEFDVSASGTEGSVEINRENIEDAGVTISYSGTLTSSTDDGTLRINNIAYALDIDAASSTDIYVAEGDGVREGMDEPEGMLNAQWDFVFAGLTDPGSSEIRFDANGDDEYDFTFTNRRGDEFSVPYAVATGANAMSFGDDDDTFVFWETRRVDAGDTFNDVIFNIDPDDYVLVTDDETDNKGDSYVLQWDDVDADDQTISFTHMGTGEEVEATFDHVFSQAANGVPLNNETNESGEITIGGNDFKFWLRQVSGAGAYSLAIDLDRDDAIGNTNVSNETVNAVVRGGGILTLTDDVTVTGGDWTATLQTLAEDLDSDVAQVLNISFTTDASTEFDLSIPSESATGSWDGTWYRVSVDDVDENRGLNAYGAMFYATDESNEADSLTIDYPHSQREAIVYVVGGDVQSSVVGGSTAQQVVTLPVGIAVLDTDVRVGDDNLIAVGGPCANSVSADLLGNPLDCAEGFTEGMGMIKAFDTPGNTVAVLVAGATARDTVQTAYVLAQHEDYSSELMGEEVEVVVAGPNDVTVRSAN